MGIQLIGAGVGDIIEVEGPEGNCKFRVLEISR
jgi:transcription elongation GreA/GreB family factor